MRESAIRSERPGKREKKGNGKGDPSSKEKRFRFVAEHEKFVETGKPMKKEVQEDVLVPITHPTKPSVENLATSFIAELKKGNGKDRTPEAALQNKIVRAAFQGRISDLEKFESDFKHEVVTERKQQYSAEIARVFTGIEHNVKVIKALKNRFEHYKRPGEEQLIATNDVLDAKKAIDLIIVQHFPEEGDHGRIDKIQLIQVKKSKQQDKKVQNDHAEHRAYFRSIFNPEQVEIRERKKYLTEAFRGRERYEEFFGEATGNIEVKDALQQYFAPIFFEYMAEWTEKMSDKKIDAAVGTLADKVDPTILKLYIEEKGAAYQFELYAMQELGEPKKSAQEMFARLRQWAADRPVTLDELKNLDPDWKSSASLFSAIEFESIVLHGQEISMEKLVTRDKGGKGLTKR